MNGVAGRTASYGGTPSLGDLRKRVNEELREIKFDSQIFLRFVQIKLLEKGDYGAGKWKLHNMLNTQRKI